MIGGVHAAIEWALGIIDPLPAWASLTLISVLSGAVLLWCVGKLTAQRRVERARDRMASAVYEMRLFMDSPTAVLAAQVRMLGWSLRYLALTLPSFLVLAGPMALLYVHLDARHGYAPARVGDPLLVRVQLDETRVGHVDPSAPLEEHRCHSACRVTAAPLYDSDAGAIFLRVVLDVPGTSRLMLKIGGETVETRLHGATHASAEEVVGLNLARARGLPAAWLNTSEPPLPGTSGLRELRVAYPERRQDWLGLALPWWFFWLGLTMATALVLRRPFGVVL